MAVLKRHPYVGVFLYSICVPSGFSGGAGFDMNTRHVFPQCLLAAITLVGGGAGDAGARSGARCEVGLHLCPMAIITLSGAVSSPKLLEKKP